MSRVSDHLRTLDACHAAVTWAADYEDMQTAWDACPRGDWMLWYWGQVASGEPMSDERRPLVLATCECARHALVCVPDGEDRPRIAIETAERWARGEAVTQDDLAGAVDAAWAAAYVAAAWAASTAAWAAATAYTAAYATDDAAAAAEIVRRHMPTPPGGAE
jgi:hypothetical protein